MSLDRSVKALLIFVPIALIAELTGGSPEWIFMLAALGIIELADFIC